MERIEQYQPDFTYKETEYEYVSSTFSKNGEIFISSNSDNVYRLHRLEKPEEMYPVKSPDYGCGLIKATHHPHVILSSFNTRGILNSLGLLSFHTKTFLRMFHGHTDEIVSIDFSNTDDTFISTSRDGKLMFWTHDQSKPLASIGFNRKPIACFNNDGSKIIVSEANMIYIFDTRYLSTGEAVKHFETIKFCDYSKIICSMNDTKIALSSPRGDIVVCENFKSNKVNSTKWSTFDSTERNDAPSIAFSTDSSRLLFATGQQNGLHIYNFEKEETYNFSSSNPYPIRSIECNLKYPLFATCSNQVNWFAYK